MISNQSQFGQQWGDQLINNDDITTLKFEI